MRSGTCICSSETVRFTYPSGHGNEPPAQPVIRGDAHGDGMGTELTPHDPL